MITINYGGRQGGKTKGKWTVLGQLVESLLHNRGKATVFGISCVEGNALYRNLKKKFKILTKQEINTDQKYVTFIFELKTKDEKENIYER
jgi:hypothetical protein